MNIKQTPEITQKRLEIAEKHGLSPLISLITERTSKSIDVILCYLSRDPTDLGKELKSLMITSMNFLGNCPLGREISAVISNKVFATYVPLYALRHPSLGTKIGGEITDTVIDSVSGGLSHYEQIVDILKLLSFDGLDKHLLLEEVERYISKGGKLTIDLLWLENSIIAVKSKTGR